MTRVALVLVLVLVPHVADADERFRVGLNVSETVTGLHGPAFGLDGDVPAGPVSLRGRIEHGWLTPNASYGEPHDDDPASMWRISAGVESRSNFANDGSVTGFATFSVGAMRIAGGYLEAKTLFPDRPDTIYAGVAGVQGGVELGSKRVRVRPGLGLSAWLGSKKALDIIQFVPNASIGVDLSF